MQLKYFSLRKPLQSLKLIHEANFLRYSGGLDNLWYLQVYPDVAKSNMEAVWHYLLHGAKEGRNPSNFFDTNWYLEQYPDVAQSGMNPLVHYLRYGVKEGRYPLPTINPESSIRGNELDSNYCIKSGYEARDEIRYYEIKPTSQTGLIHQPHVYELAAFLGKRYACTHIIDIGCGNAEKLVKLKDDFTIIGIDFGSNIEFCQANYDFGIWIEADLEQETHLKIDKRILEHAVIICADVIEHLANPGQLLKLLHSVMNYSPVGLVSTPERDRARSIDDYGPPGNPYHVREWTLDELVCLFKKHDFQIEFSGLTLNNTANKEKNTSLVILSNNFSSHIVPAPANFRVVAIMNAYNEADIIGASIQRLIQQGIEVYLIDNWSTDGTAEIASQFLGRGLIHIEKFPPEGRGEYHNWHRLLKNVEAISYRLQADWYIHHDIDEFRASPWQGVSLRDAFYHVQRSGFNSVDFTLSDFHPIDNTFVPGTDFVNHFKYWEFPTSHHAYFVQIKAWRNVSQEIKLAQTGGHKVTFDGQRIFPYKFFTRHYRLRSEEHAHRKLYLDRKPSEDGKSRGWHNHWDDLKQVPVLKSRKELNYFDDSFYQNFLVERLSGIGIID